MRDLLRDILTRRLTQVLARYLALLLVALAVKSDATKVDATAEVLSEVAVAAALIGVDHLMHYLRGKLEKKTDA